VNAGIAAAARGTLRRRQEALRRAIAPRSKSNIVRAGRPSRVPEAMARPTDGVRGKSASGAGSRAPAGYHAVPAPPVRRDYPPGPVPPVAPCPRMNTTESLDDIVIESNVVKAARLTFLGSLLFWPLFLLAALFMLGPVGKTSGARMRRDLLVYSTWLYPVAVGVGWYYCKRGLRLGLSDVLCLLPWLLPALIFCYWLGYFLV
jgi:hypothetical protein